MDWSRSRVLVSPPGYQIGHASVFYGRKLNVDGSKKLLDLMLSLLFSIKVAHERKLTRVIESIDTQKQVNLVVSVE